MRAYRKNCYILLNTDTDQIRIIIQDKPVVYVSCVNSEEIRIGTTEQVLTNVERWYGFKLGTLPLVIM